MLLKGKPTADTETILQELFVACHRLEAQFRDVKDAVVRRAIFRLYEDLSAVAAGIIEYVRHVDKPATQVVAVLLRTLVDCCISVFVFCQDPATRAALYLNFPAVLDWQWVLLQEKHVGCWLIPNEPKFLARMAVRKKEAKETIARYGADYVKPKKGQTPEEILGAALCNEGSPRSRFRNRWFTQTPREVLVAERMGWAYDVWYVRLCSAVHSDAAASKLFPLMTRDHAVTHALTWFGAALYRIVEALRFRLAAHHKGVLRDSYNSFR